MASTWCGKYMVCKYYFVNIKLKRNKTEKSALFDHVSFSTNYDNRCNFYIRNQVYFFCKKEHGIMYFQVEKRLQLGLLM